MHPGGRNHPYGTEKQDRDADKFRFMEETMKNKNQLIGCCGLDCEKCDARIATIANDNTLREKTAALWTKLNGVTILPEMINCTGCRIEDAKTPFCDKLCPVHNCVREKRTGYLRRLRADGRMSDAGENRRKQPVCFGKSEAVETG